MAQNTKSLHKAKKEKNDEFYTQLGDIEKELRHYTEHFKGKVVFCNCDDPDWSNFWKYFYLNFHKLGLKKLISTHYEPNGSSYKLEYTGDLAGMWQTTLAENGDFRSPECVALMQEADIVITNPPFSLFREYVAQLIEYEKQFLIIGSMNAITYKETFKLIKDNLIWLGNSNPKIFRQPDNTLKNFGNVCWYTNLSHKKRAENIILFRQYHGNEASYPKYVNYDAIEVSKVADIPCDYVGAMGVPITYLEKHNPTQFDIVGMAEDNGKGFSGGLWDGKNPHCVVNGKNKFKRIFIRAKVDK